MTHLQDEKLDSSWESLARRLVVGLEVHPGELIQVRGDPGSYAFLLEVLLAIELAGATPLPELLPGVYYQRLLASAPLETLGEWHRRRMPLLEQVDRVLTFQRPPLDLSAVPAEARRAWERATSNLIRLEEERKLPVLAAALPSAAWAEHLGIPRKDLETHMMPALTAASEELQAEIERLLSAVGDGRTMMVHSGEGHTLSLQQGGRPWLSDDGRIDAADRERGAVVSNLPAGSIYTTVLEDQTEGSLYLPRAGEAEQVVFHFEGGRIQAIEAARGAEALAEWLDEHPGEPRRISHIGVGLNPYLREPIGWTIVDEHVHGCLFFALGENRYMGGANASSLNVDYTIPNASLLVEGRSVVAEGLVRRK